MARFVSEYAAKTAGKYDELRVSPVWQTATMDRPETEATTLQMYALKLILLNAAAFDRRLHKDTNAFHLQALRIGDADADTECRVRMGI